MNDMGFIAKTKRKAPKGGVRQAMPHDSARKHVTGAAIYADDMPEPSGLLHCWQAALRPGWWWPLWLHTCWPGLLGKSGS